MGSYDNPWYSSKRGIVIALSTLLFAAYMDAPLKLIRRDMIQLFNRPTGSILDTVYVKDCDFITNDPDLLILKSSHLSIPILGSNIQISLYIYTKCVKDFW